MLTKQKFLNLQKVAEVSIQLKDFFYFHKSGVYINVRYQLLNKKNTKTQI